MLLHLYSHEIISSYFYLGLLKGFQDSLIYKVTIEDFLLTLRWRCVNLSIPSGNVLYRNVSSNVSSN